MTLVTMAEREREAEERISDWFTKHPEAFLTFSGGKDSLVILHMMRRMSMPLRVAYFDTGLAFTQTRRYVMQLDREWGLGVKYIQTNPTPLDVLAASGHYAIGTPTKTPIDMKRLLIDDYLEAAQREFQSIYSLYGLRADESVGRRACLHKRQGIVTRHHKDGSLRDSSNAPIWDWNTRAVNTYLLNNKVPLNPVYRRMRELGIPPEKRRTGVVVSDGIHLGDWATNRQVDPSLCRVVESKLPILTTFR